jgi:hypothetical protein
MRLSSDLREFIERLNSNEVEYLLVGALAVSWHGMTSVTGVSFNDAWEDRAPGDLDGLPVNFIGRSSLLRNKDATGRAQGPHRGEELRKQKPPTWRS